MVRLCSTLNQLAALDGEDCDPGPTRRDAAGSDAVQIPGLGAAGDPTDHDPVFSGDHVLNDDFEVRVRSP